MHLAIVGPGRLGRTLAPLLRGAGHDVALLGRGAAPGPVDAVLLTVPDARIASVAATIPAGPVLLHCSGAAGLDVLRPRAPVGSLHPLMTFPGPEIAIPPLRGVPAAVAGDPDALEVARALAADLELVPFEIPGDRRLYHAAAVIAGNFATVLLAEASAVLAAAGVPRDRAPEILSHLALASIRNAAEDPRAALTGPAARGDAATIDAHREALARHALPDALALYDLMTAAARALVSARSPDGSREYEG